MILYKQFNRIVTVFLSLFSLSLCECDLNSMWIFNLNTQKKMGLLFFTDIFDQNNNGRKYRHKHTHTFIGCQMNSVVRTILVLSWSKEYTRIYVEKRRALQILHAVKTTKILFDFHSNAENFSIIHAAMGALPIPNTPNI